MPAADTSLKIAYQRAELNRHGISFERAMNERMFKMCLERMATNLEQIKQPPLPKRACTAKWQAFKD